jgi:hypothetical protein
VDVDIELILMNQLAIMQILLEGFPNTSISGWVANQIRATEDRLISSGKDEQAG